MSLDERISLLEDEVRRLKAVMDLEDEVRRLKAVMGDKDEPRVDRTVSEPAGYYDDGYCSVTGRYIGKTKPKSEHDGWCSVSGRYRGKEWWLNRAQ